MNEEKQKDELYTSKIKIPIYEPRGEKPEISELVDVKKYNEVSAKIAQTTIDPEIKNFLRRAATRHYKFNYAKIAEYYAHADKDVQQLFEDSALVIIDFDAAIAGGFVQMNKRLMEIRKNEP